MLIAWLAASLFGVSTLNSGGGTNASNGLRLIVGDTGQIQVYRATIPQFYASSGLDPIATSRPEIDNGFYMVLGPTGAPTDVVGPPHANFPLGQPTDWTVASAPSPAGNIVGGGSVSLSLSYTGGYAAQLTYVYDVLTQFITLSVTFTIPPGNTKDVRLYVAYDSTLNGFDNGPSFASADNNRVGVYLPSGGTYEALRYRSGTHWTGRYAGQNNCMFDPWVSQPGFGCSAATALNQAGHFNSIASGDTDNGFGAEWHLGSAPGVYTFSNDLIFLPYIPSLEQSVGATSIASGASTTWQFILQNTPSKPVQSGLGFTATLPAGLSIANASVTNTCNGTLTDVAGGALASGDSGIKLTGGTMAAGLESCSVTVNITGSNSTASTVMYDLGPSRESALSGVLNDVGPDALSVLPSVPIVVVNAPSPISTVNQATYPVSGTCSANGGSVAVGVGAVTGSTACLASAFSTSLNVTTVADGNSVVVSASQTNMGGLGSDSKTTSKSTSAPFVIAVSTAAADGVYKAGASIPLSVSLSEPVTATTLTATLNSGAMVSLSCAAACTGTYVVAAGENAALLDIVGLIGSLSDGSGNTNSSPVVGEALSQTRAIAVDTTAPGAPVLQADGNGTAEPGSTVVVSEGGTPVCTATAGANGAFVCELSLSVGAHALVAVAKDAAGNDSAQSATVTFVLSAVVPPAPVIESPGEGAVNPDEVVRGLSAPGTTVTVREGDTVLCTALSDDTGHFACTAPIFEKGVHVIAATADGSAPSLSVTFETTRKRGTTDGDPTTEDPIGDLNGGINIKKKGCGCASTPSSAEAALLGVAALYLLQRSGTIRRRERTRLSSRLS